MSMAHKSEIMLILHGGRSITSKSSLIKLVIQRRNPEEAHKKEIRLISHWGMSIISKIRIIKLVILRKNPGKAHIAGRRSITSKSSLINLINRHINHVQVFNSSQKEWAIVEV
jgi:hypothetical protein